MNRKTRGGLESIDFDRPMTLPTLKPVSRDPIPDPHEAMNRLLAPSYADVPEVVLLARLDDLLDDDGIQLTDLFPGEVR